MMKYKGWILFLFFVCLTPLLWFRSGFLVTGADINFPLDPVGEFLRRTQAWDGVYQGGRDNCMNFSALPFVAVQTFFYLITHSLIWTEKLSFVFWFMFTGFSVYFLISRVIFKNAGGLVRIGTCLFYLFNFYALSCWAGVHIAGITALATLPVMFGLFVRVLGGVEVKRSILFFCLVSIFSAGLWLNPPQLVVFGSVFFIYFLFHLGELIKDGNWLRVRAVLNRCIVLWILYVLLNSYAILPFIEGIRGSGANEAVKDYNVVKYMDFQSAYSSPLNVLRLMGNSELYQKWTTGEYYFPFFEKYIVRRLFIPLSFILPVLAFIGVILNSKDRFTQFLFCLAVIGIVFGMGPHPPMDKIYPWLVTHIPGFYIFRSPWLKFSLLTMFSYSILAGMGLVKVGEVGHRLKPAATTGAGWGYQRVVGMFCVGVVALYLFFMHSFIFGEMYTPVEKRVDLGPLHVKIPDYVFLSGDWMNAQNGDFTVALLPEEMCNIYEWGYSAIDDILTKVSNKAILYGEYKEAVNVPGLVKMYHLFMKVLYNEMTYKIENFLSLLGVRYLIQRNDFRYYFYGDKDSPRFIKDRMEKQTGISYERGFGEWDVYRNNGWRNNYIHLANFLIWVEGDKGCLLPISELMDVFPSGSVFLFSKDNKEFDTASIPDRQSFCLMVNSGLGEKRDGILFYNLKSGDIVSLDRRLWIEKGGKYNVFIKLKTDIRELILSLGEGMLFPGKDIMHWDYKPNRVEYKKEVSGEVLDVEVIFDGGPKEDEYVQIRKDDLDIDLMEYPLFTMDYILDDPAVQIIEFIFGLDYDGDRQVDGYLRGFRTTDPTYGHKMFQLDVLGEVVRRVPLKKKYNLVLLELYCHKYWGVDCSQSDRRGNYRFRIGRIKFSQAKKKEVVEVYDYGFKFGGKDVNTGFIRLNDKSVKVYMPVGKVDLLRYPEIKVRYRLKCPSAAQAIKAFARLYPRYGEGRERLIFIGEPLVRNEYSEFRVNLTWLKDLLKDYYLDGIEFRIEGGRLNRDVSKIIKVKEVCVFNSRYTNRWQKDGGEYKILGLNNDVINLDEVRQNGIIPREMIITRGIDLDEGINRVRLLLDKDSFLKCQWVCLLPDFDSIGMEPVARYEKMSETLYRVEVDNANRSFILVMKNNFDKRWRMCVKENGSRLREVKGHFVANGFANGWLVNGVNGGDELIIRYYPQKLFKIGLVVSIVTLFGLIWIVWR